ncbi:MAG: hypothetical protein LBN02_05315 [Oscillospiraceae bacterium]|jgi:hypothetical protein|nr:hypothetical protein [Oscillospiraceae bacterium]
MKKLLKLVLSLTLALTLTACNTPTVEPVPSPSPTPTQPSPTPTPIIGAYLPDIPREFPDEPYSPLTVDEIGTQYYGEPQVEFVPSDDYGAIVPYIGGISSGKSNGMLGSALTGFATLDGRVICEPIFSDCQVLSRNGDTAYIARLLRYVNGENVREDWLIPASGACAERYDEIYTGFSALYELDRNEFEIGDSYQLNEYISVARGGKYGLTNLAGEEILPLISDARVEPFAAPFGDAYLITELSENRIVVDIDLSDLIGEPLGTHVEKMYVPETTAHYFINAAGERVSENEYVDYQEHKDIATGDTGNVLTDFDFGYTVPDGYIKKAYTILVAYAAHAATVALYNTHYDREADLMYNVPLECLDIDPPFALYATSTYAETRLPDGIVIVRRSLPNSVLD